MIINDKEVKILLNFELNADKKTKDIAQKLNYKEHSVIYTLHKLKQEKLIELQPFIDMFALGYQDYALYFSHSLTNSEDIKKLDDYLVNHYLTSCVVKMGGDYNYGVMMYSKNIKNFLNFLEEVSQKFPNVFFHKSFSIRTSFTRFNRNYLNKETKKEYIKMNYEQQEKIDELDKQILNQLGKTPTQSDRTLAQIMNLPTSSINNRLRKLRQKKILRNNNYLVNTNKLNIHTYELFLYTKGLESQQKKELFDFYQREPHVIHFLECIGEWDFEIGIEAKSPEQAQMVINSLYEKFGNFLHTVKSIPIFSYHKYTISPLD